LFKEIVQTGSNKLPFTVLRNHLLRQNLEEISNCIGKSEELQQLHVATLMNNSHPVKRKPQELAFSEGDEAIIWIKSSSSWRRRAE
jgi:hypothetical protein